MVKNGIRLAAFTLAFVLCFFAAQRLFTPKYMSGVYEGALIREYYDNEKRNQVLFIGDCEVYESFSPIALWEEYGITSYIRGAPQQLIWQSYYFLEDTLRVETPDVVVLSVLSMKYAAPQSEAYNRLNLDGMRLSISKINAVRASMTEGESLLSYVFPILRYHDRWIELGADDLRYFPKADRVSHNGYTMRCDVKPVDVIPVGQALADYRFSEICYAYLDKMAALCEEKGIRFILIKAPSVYPYWYPQWDAQMAAYAGAHGLLYLNLLELCGEIGIDYATDTYDGGLHLNLYGAEKLSRYFGQFLSARCSLPDMRGDTQLSAVWSKKCEAYYKMKAAQLREIDEYGEVRTFTY